MSWTFERCASTGRWTATALTAEGELSVEGGSMREVRLALERMVDPKAPQEPEDDLDVPPW